MQAFLEKNSKKTVFFSNPAENSLLRTAEAVQKR